MRRSRSPGVVWTGILLGCTVGLAFSRPAAGETPDETFVRQAVEAYVAAAASPAVEEDVWTLAAAPLLDFRAHPAALGRLWVGEIALAAGGTGLWRRAKEEALESGEAPRAALSRIVSDMARSDGRALLRAAVRLYVSIEPEASPSRLKAFDLETGALDAAAPKPMSVRHRTFVPEEESETLRFFWPADGGDGAAVIRYTDSHLPADVVYFAAGERRSISLSGVARIDFLVAGGEPAPSGLAAPVECVRDSVGAFTRLEARVASGAAGPLLTWSTASHDGLLGWAVFREELLRDGRIARVGPEIVPSSETSDEAFRYAFVDTSASPETFYRYTVWAVTGEGLLARAFSATLETARAR